MTPIRRTNGRESGAMPNGITAPRSQAVQLSRGQNAAVPRFSSREALMSATGGTVQNGKGSGQIAVATLASPLPVYKGARGGQSLDEVLGRDFV